MQDGGLKLLDSGVFDRGGVCVCVVGERGIGGVRALTSELCSFSSLL